MLKKDIYIGDVRINEDGEDRKYSSFCPLLFLGNGAYINLDWINTIPDYLKFYKVLLTGKLDDTIVLYEHNKNGVYIDRAYIQQYYEEPGMHRVTKRRIYNDILMDPRMPGGVEIEVIDENSWIERRLLKNPNPNKKRRK